MYRELYINQNAFGVTSHSRYFFVPSSERLAGTQSLTSRVIAKTVIYERHYTPMPDDAFTRKWMGSPLVQVMAWCLLLAWTLPEPILTCCQQNKDNLAKKLCFRFIALKTSINTRKSKHNQFKDASLKPVSHLAVVKII